MSSKGFQYVYGPVPSRRLGRSLGIDLVPFKTCTYDCIYCQLGRTTDKTTERKEYVSANDIVEELERKLSDGDSPDYISLAGSGEPTLNLCIGELIDRIKTLTGIPVAVLTNGSLLWMTEIQHALMDADLVLPSLDAGDEALFRCVNRPHKDISFGRMVDGIAAFTRRFRGEVWLEVLLLGGVTGIPAEAEKLAVLIRKIQPTRVQLNTASRPPAEEFVFSLSPDQMVALKGFFPGRVDIVSSGERGVAPTTVLSNDRKGDILALLGRRPCTVADVAGGLAIHMNEALKHLDNLLAAGKARTIVTGGRNFYTINKNSG